MSEVVFTHPDIDLPSLRVAVKPDSIFWSYGLNTANYPTYGGEVVQILSVYFDDLEITGMIQGYPELEKIYRWFIRYFQLATQGNSGRGSYNTDPVIMNYPERQWSFRLYPKSLPGFKYGRDVVVPQWKVVAAVDEPNAHSPGSLSSLIISDTTQKFIESEGIQLFGKATAEIGFNRTDPFSGYTPQDYKKGTVRDAYGKLADSYTKTFLPSYLTGDFKDLTADYSKPMFLRDALHPGEALAEASDPITVNPGVAKAKKIADRTKSR